MRGISPETSGLDGIAAWRGFAGGPRAGPIDCACAVMVHRSNGEGARIPLYEGLSRRRKGILPRLRDAFFALFERGFWLDFRGIRSECGKFSWFRIGTVWRIEWADYRSGLTIAGMLIKQLLAAIFLVNQRDDAACI
jgi:hypothetical protein